MPSQQHDVLHEDMTPELSLEVLGLSLETRNYTEDERQHLRTQCEHADKPVPAWGCLWSARKKPMPRQLPFTCWHTAGPGIMGQSFNLGKRQETQPPFHFVVRLCLRAMTTSPLQSVDVGIYVQFYLRPILSSEENTIKPRKLWCSPHVVDI